MTDKEKLEKALVHLKKFIDGDCVTDDEILADFPELEDSKDERMRKALIRFFNEKRNCVGYTWGGFKCDDVIAYLEKQEEQKKEELVYRLNGLMQEYINESKDEVEQEHRFKCYKLFWNALEDTSYFDEQKEQKPHRFCDDTLKAIDKAREFDEQEQKPVEWHPEDEQNLNVCLSYIKDEPLRSWLIDAIHVRYDKPVWSEEDEDAVRHICRYLGYHCNEATARGCTEWLNVRLKSLRPPKDCSDCSKHLQGYIDGSGDAEKKLLDEYGILIMPEGELHMKARWKPSEEQIQAITYLASSIPPNFLKEQEYTMRLVDEVISNLKKLCQ